MIPLFLFRMRLYHIKWLGWTEIYENKEDVVDLVH